MTRVLREYELDGARVTVSTPPTRRGTGKIRVTSERIRGAWVLTAIATTTGVDGVRVEVRREGFESKPASLAASCALRSIAKAELARGRRAA